MATKPPTTILLSSLAMEGADFHNPRLSVVTSEIKALAKSIVLQGLITPLAVWRTSVDKKTVNVVVDGGRRFRALVWLDGEGLLNSDLERKGIPVRIVQAKSLRQARITALTGNLQRKELNSYEVAKEISSLVEDGMKQKAIAASLSKSATWVSRLLKSWNKATPAVSAAWKAGKLPDDDIQSLVLLPDEEQIKRLAEVLKARESAGDKKATREDRAKARDIAKGKPAANKDKGDKPSPAAPTKDPKVPKVTVPTDAVFEMIKLAGDADVKKNPYVAGIRDALRLATKEIGYGELDKAWSNYIARDAFKTDKKAPAKKAAKAKK